MFTAHRGGFGAFCCTRAENDRARLSALDAARAVVERKLEELSELTATPTSQLKFLPDAWAQARGPALAFHTAHL